MCDLEGLGTHPSLPWTGHPARFVKAAKAFSVACSDTSGTAASPKSKNWAISEVVLGVAMMTLRRKGATTTRAV